MRIAGVGRRGCADGAGSRAYFNAPSGICELAADVWAVADADSNRLRLVCDGEVTTLSDETWLSPAGMCLADAGRSLLVCDAGHHKIRLVKLQAGRQRGLQVLQLAGCGRRGHTDGPAALAAFNGPRDACVAPDGAVIVADTGNNAIRRIAPRGGQLFVETIAGGHPRAGHVDGPSRAQFAAPEGVDADEDGRLLVADAGNHCVRLLTPSGSQGGGWVVSTVAGQPCMPGAVDGPALEARFRHPGGVAAAFGGFVVADTGNGRLRFVSNRRGKKDEAAVRTVAGTEELAYRPRALAVSADTVTVADAGSHIVYRVELRGGERLPPPPPLPMAVAVAGGVGVGGDVGGDDDGGLQEDEGADEEEEDQILDLAQDEDEDEDEGPVERIESLLRQSIVERHHPIMNVRPQSAARRRQRRQRQQQQQQQPKPQPQPQPQPAAEKRRKPRAGEDLPLRARNEFLERENGILRAENAELQRLLADAAGKIEALLAGRRPSKST